MNESGTFCHQNVSHSWRLIVGPATALVRLMGLPEQSSIPTMKSRSSKVSTEILTSQIEAFSNV